MIDIIAKTETYLIPPGWLEVKCEQCNRRCFIGPKQKEAIRKLGYVKCRIICNKCEKVEAHRAVLADEVLDKQIPKE